MKNKLEIKVNKFCLEILKRHLFYNIFFSTTTTNLKRREYIAKTEDEPILIIGRKRQSDLKIKTRLNLEYDYRGED